MKPKRGKEKHEDQLSKLTATERAALRHRTKLVAMLDDVKKSVHDAPPEMNMPRRSIEGLLMTACYLLDVHDGLQVMDDEYFMKAAIRELSRALGALGLGVDYWEKINAWRFRDLTERGDTDFLVVE